MKHYIIEKQMRNNVDGYFAVVVEGEKHINRTVITSQIQFFCLESGYNYCHPIEAAKQNAMAIAAGLNELERIKQSEGRMFVNDPTYN